MLRFSLLALLSVVLLLSCSSKNLRDTAADPCARLVTTTEGVYQGTVAEQGVCAWKGIPFASSGPAYRFKKPGPAPKFEGTKVTAEFGPGCTAPLLGWVSPGGSAEDCLNLNIWRTAGVAPEKKLPVMVFLYGGAFILGSGSWPTYDGAALAREGVVLVTLNYRLGPLGFYASPAMQKDDPSAPAGNWGIWDQIAALTWLRENIAQFGGDPGNVTIFGESAGGFSVCTLVASPAAAGLFHKAIMQSGGCFVNAASDSFAGWKTFVDQTDCHAATDVEACFRVADAEDISLRHRMWDGAVPMIDGVLLKEQPLEAIRNGRANAVPLLIGANREEWRPLTLIPSVAWNLSISNEELWGRLSAVNLQESVRLKRLYGGSGGDVRSMWVDAVTDAFFRCTVVWAAEGHSLHAPAFAYEFDIGERNTWSKRQMGAYHALELPYVFGNLTWEQVMNGSGILPEARIYSERIRRYWTTFASTGAPGEPWPEFVAGKSVLRLQPEGDKPLPGYKQDQCAYWASTGMASFPTQIASLVRFSNRAGIPISLVFGEWE